MTRSVIRTYCAAVLFLLYVLFSSSISTSAQTAGTGALTGTVTDATGAVVPNATVTATSADTGQSRTATTGADGVYTISLLPPGAYHVKFEASGFQTAEIPSANVNVTETEVLNRSLQVGTQTQEVSVQADVETIQTATSALGTVVNTQTMTDLPLNTRNYTNILAMSAGANSAVQDASLIGKGSTLIAVNGAGTAQNTFLQDGVVINNWFSFNTGVEGVSVGAFAIPNPDAISEFKIQTSSYDAGYGRNPGANVNVITKSGTNEYHGTAFEFFRNTDLDANNWFRAYNDAPRAVLNSNQYGGVFGGPVKKDKLFFFVSYQETSQKNGLTGYGSASATAAPIPTGNRGTCPTGWTTLSQCDAAGQAFVPALAAAVCPANHKGITSDNTSVSGGVNIQCPGPGATDPLFNLNPIAISILQLKLPNGSYLVPSSGAPPTNSAGGYALQTYSVPAIFADHQGIGNFDYVISSKETLSGRYEYEKDPLTAQFPVQNATQQGNFVPGNPVTTIKINQSAVLKLTSIVTSNLVNEAHIAYQRYPIVNNIDNPFTNSQVGITDLRPGIDILSGITIGSSSGPSIATGMSWGGQYQYGGTVVTNQFQAGDQISWTHARHSIRAGFEVVHVQDASVNYGSPVGNPTFATWADFFIGRSGGCGAAATPTATNRSGCNGGSGSNIGNDGGTLTYGNLIPYDWRTNDLDGFVQDDIKITSRLTINAGLRWEYDGYPTEQNGDFTDIWPSLINTVPVPGSGCVVNGVSIGAGASGTGCSLAGFVVPANYVGPLPTGLDRNDNNSVTRRGAPWDDFAPRLGFAWQPTASNRWVVRGGAGYFYELIPGASTAQLGTPLTGSPVISSLTTGSLANPWQNAATIPGPPGEFGFTPRWINLQTGANSNINQPPVAQNLTVPLTYEWNLNTQYEFLPTWVLELGYVGSHGIHEAAVSTGGQQGQTQTVNWNIAPLVGPGCTSCAITGVTTNSPGNVPLRVPYLGFAASSLELANLDSYKYNSLQVTVRKQLSHGLQLQAAYTWSRGFVQIPYGINTYPYYIQRFMLNPSYRPQRLILNYVWDLPLGHQQGFLGKVTSGWTWSGVTTIQDGSPLTPTDAAGSDFCGGAGCSGNGLNATGNFCPGMGPANVLTSGSMEQRVLSGLIGGPGYFNGKAQGVFCAAPTGTQIPGVSLGTGTGFGNVGPGIVLGPGQSNWDMSLSKTTRVGGIREGATLQFRSEFFNTFNHPQFSNPNTALNQGGFGEISGTSVSPRIIQFALKYSF